MMWHSRHTSQITVRRLVPFYLELDVLTHARVSLITNWVLSLRYNFSLRFIKYYKCNSWWGDALALIESSSCNQLKNRLEANMISLEWKWPVSMQIFDQPVSRFYNSLKNGIEPHQMLSIPKSLYRFSSISTGRCLSPKIFRVWLKIF